MRKSFSVVSAAFCLSVIATAGMAAGSGASSGSSQSVTGTQLGSPQEASPATGNAMARTVDLQPSQSDLPCHCWSDGVDTTRRDES